jgi:hypothetical protein
MCTLRGCFGISMVSWLHEFVIPGPVQCPIVMFDSVRVRFKSSGAYEKGKKFVCHRRGSNLDRWASPCLSREGGRQRRWPAMR